MTKIDIENVLAEAITLVYSSEKNEHVSPADIRNSYNENCDIQPRVSSDEYSLAATLASGAVAEQFGSNIQATAAIAYLKDMLDTARK